MHFGFAIDLSDIDLWYIDLLDTDLDLLDTDIPSKHFVSFKDVLKTSSRPANVCWGANEFWFDGDELNAWSNLEMNTRPVQSLLIWGLM